VLKDTGVPFTFVTVRPINQAARLGVVLALAALGVLLPLALLWLINRRGARLSLKGLQMARVPVRLEFAGDAVVLSRLDDQSALLTAEDFNWIRSDLDREREWSPGPERICSVTPRNPFGSVTALVQAPSGQIVMSSHHPTTSETGHNAGMSLDPAGQFYLVTSIPQPSQVRAEMPAAPAFAADDPFAPSTSMEVIPSGSVAVANGATGTLVAFIKPEYGGSSGAIERLVSSITGSSLIGRSFSELRSRQTVGASQTQRREARTESGKTSGSFGSSPSPTTSVPPSTDAASFGNPFDLGGGSSLNPPTSPNVSANELAPPNDGNPFA